MGQQERARQIARTIEDALLHSASGPAPASGCAGTSPATDSASLLAEQSASAAEPTLDLRADAPNFSVTTRGGCVACNPGICALCGHIFSGIVIVVNHVARGQRTLSDKALHYLAHGVTRYETGYMVHGRPVAVELDLDELAGYLDL